MYSHFFIKKIYENKVFKTLHNLVKNDTICFIEEYKNV